MTRAFVGFGSNMGDRRAAILRAAQELAAVPGVRRVRLSSVRETEPWGRTDQPRFLNAVAELETDLSAEELCRQLRAIEDRLGRVRVPSDRWGPRTIDLDLLVFGDEVIQTPQLRVPHPDLGERLFVLESLAELDADLRIPGQRRRVAELVAALRGP